MNNWEKFVNAHNNLIGEMEGKNIDTQLLTDFIQAYNKFIGSDLGAKDKMFDKVLESLKKQ